ncbi:pseudouridine synthase [Polycladidibacter hongkongensis]|uniref:pseudouridine synthase n=1 Tax=Polycladidibacter hongkongensis TaxID=1647556 RepID=UPI00082B8271|nr:pseudouridine synthase [Pseudovibrio hongkongensis]
MKLAKHLANLGYGSRKEMALAIKNGWITNAQGARLQEGQPFTHADIRLDGAPLDPPLGSLIMLHKPVGYTCSTKDHGALVYQLLPERFLRRKPPVSTIGRLDKDTSGLLLLTDDGKLLHKIISPKSDLPKTYEVTLDRPLHGEEVQLFASGTLLLNGETTPLKPAEMEIISSHQARVTITEGRYHQVRRMFAATGNHVSKLHRSRIGTLSLADLEQGKWRLVQKQGLF